MPIEGTIGAADHIFITAMYAARGRGGRVWQVHSEKAPYWYRVHENQEQATRNLKYGSVIGIVRDIISAEWETRWGS